MNVGLRECASVSAGWGVGGNGRNRRYLAFRHGSREGRQSVPVADAHHTEQGPLGVKEGKTRIEHKLWGLPEIADIHSKCRGFRCVYLTELAVLDGSPTLSAIWVSPAA